MKVSVAIPFYNEEDCADNVISSLVREINKSKEDIELILVNNGSEDNTEEILEKWAKKRNIKYYKVKKNKGYGYGIIQGMKQGSGDYIGFMDGDGQVKETDLIRCVKAIKEHPSEDLIKVMRSKRHDPFIRTVVSKAFNLLARMLFGLKVQDINSVPKIMKRDVYEKIQPLKSYDWFIDSEIIIKSQQRGYSIKEIPVVFRKREEGSSSVSVKTVFEFLKNLIKTKLYGW